MNCRHCQSHKVNRPRGLCWSCYYRPGIREKYPSTSKFGRRGAGIGPRSASETPVPTSALPGTEEKLAIFEQRAALRQSLWHPLDGRIGSRPTSIAS